MLFEIDHLYQQISKESRWNSATSSLSG